MGLKVWDRQSSGLWKIGEHVILELGMGNEQDAGRLPMFSRAVMYHFGDRIWWFRIFGWGLVVKDTRHWPELFTERMGIKPWLYVGHFAIRYLRPGLI